MTLTKCKLGEWLELREVCNANLTYGADRVRGVNNVKKLMPTKADLAGRDLSKFQIVSPGDFVFNHRTSRNGEKFSIAYNDTAEDVICTEDYVVFRVSEKGRGKVLPEWLYMYFNRPEFDRYVITNSWGSSTEFFNWEDLCAVEINLPPLPVQKKYVAVYNAMIANFVAYERGLDDIKLTYDVTIEEWHKGHLQKSDNRGAIICSIGKLVKLFSQRVGNPHLSADMVSGVNRDKEFFEPSHQVGADTSKYQIVPPGHFACNLMHVGRDRVLPVAMNTLEHDKVVSPAYTIFSVQDESLILREYFFVMLKTPGRDHYFWFHTDASVRDGMSWHDFCEIELKLPSLFFQKLVADLHITYRKRKSIHKRLRTLVSSICPILIKGSMDEGKRK